MMVTIVPHHAVTRYGAVRLLERLLRLPQGLSAPHHTLLLTTPDGQPIDLATFDC